MTYAAFDLTGKVALVTGGNRGIGLGMADALAQAGADVVIWGRWAGANAEAAARLEARGRATDMNAAAHGSEKFNSRVIGRVPLRRWGRSEDFGGIAVYFASDASRYHTGDAVLIDGGYATY